MLNSWEQKPDISCAKPYSLAIWGAKMNVSFIFGKEKKSKDPQIVPVLFKKK
jgi:hypothetical protein